VPDAQLIGRVAVKVLPDTSDFRRRAEKQLSDIETQINEVTVATKANMVGALRDLLEGARKINAENRSMDSRKIRFHATFARTSMDEEITKAVRTLEDKAANRKVKISADLVAGTVQLDLDQQALDHVKRQLDDWRKDNDPIKVQVQPELAFGATTIINGRLDYIARPRRIPLLPYVDNAALAKVATSLAALSGARVITGYFRDLGRMLGNLDKNVPIIGSVAVAVMGLGGAGIAATSNLAALSASLASILPLALTFPGVLGAFALGIGATVIAFKDFNTVLPQVKTQLTQLADAISANFWAVAAQPIAHLVDTLLPQFSAGMRGASTQLGEFFAGLATALGGSLEPALAGMFADLSLSIDTATASTGAMASVITILGQVGASYLPRLATWFVDIANQFNAWLSAAAADGRLKGWIDTAIVAFGQLGSVLLSVGQILGGIATAATAAGGSSLGTLADTLARISTVVNSTDFQTALTGVFTAAHTAMQQIATISGPAVEALFTSLAATLQTILPSVGVTIGTLLDAVAAALSQPAFHGGLIALFKGLQTAATALAPALGPVGVALGALGELIGTFAATLGPLAATAFTAIAQALTTLAPALNQLIPLLGGALNGALIALAPVLAQVAAAVAGLVTGGLIPALTTAFGALGPVVAVLAPLLGQMLSTALGALGPVLTAIGTLLAQIAPIIGQVATQMLPVIMPLLTAVGTALGAILTALAPLVGALLNLIVSILVPIEQAVMKVVTAALPKFSEAIGKVVTALMPLIEVLQQVVDFLMPILAPAIEWVAKVLIDSLIAAIEGVAKVFTGVVNMIKGLWNILAGIFTGDWQRVWEGVKQVFSGIWDAIVGLFQVVLNVGILGAAKKALLLVKEAWTLGWGAIRTLAVELWASLTTRWTTFLDDLKAAPGAALSAIKKLFSSAWSDIRATCQLAWDAVRKMFVDGVNTARDTVKELPGKARDALGNLGSLLTSAGKKLIQGFIDGIKAMFGSVKDTLSNLTKKLTDWKGPPATDRVLLVGAGQLLINGLIRGMESRYAAVRKSLTSLTADIGATTVDLPTIRPGARPIGAAIAASLSTDEGRVTRVLNYYAAPGSSLDAEEDLFAAAARARMVGW
jgi:phage-related protein